MTQTKRGLYYVGTKLLKAALMTKQAYVDYRGWDLPSNEDGNELGYLVEYVDGGKPNDTRHAGYISWSPADVFERAYVTVGKLDDCTAEHQELFAEYALAKQRYKRMTTERESDSFVETPRSDDDLAAYDDHHYALEKYFQALEARVLRTLAHAFQDVHGVELLTLKPQAYDVNDDDDRTDPADTDEPGDSDETDPLVAGFSHQELVQKVYSLMTRPWFYRLYGLPREYLNTEWMQFIGGLIRERVSDEELDRRVTEWLDAQGVPV